MNETFQFGELSVAVTRKDIKNVHLTVHPPYGRVTLSLPLNIRSEVARAYVISKLRWIRDRQEQMQNQARETPRQFIGRESHYVWGRRYLMTLDYQDAKPGVVLSNKQMILHVRPGSDSAKRAEIVHEWHKALLHEAVPPLIEQWEGRLKVRVAHYFLQRMKTRWGSCNHAAGNIRLNTELVKKPKDLLEYVIVHEMAHLIVPNHGERFIAILDQHYPGWREARAELNALPLAAENWKDEAREL